MTKRRIGIAGYMGAGKTVAARLLSAAAGSGGGQAVIVDADDEAKTLMRADPGISELLVKAFGGSIINKNNLSFGTLGRIVFGSSEKLLRLNEIVHPLLVKRLCGLLEAQDDRCIILDAAVLPLWKIESLFDECLWIHAPFEKRLERLNMTRSDLDERQLRGRMRVQEECLPEPVCPPWRRIKNDGSVDRLAGTLSGTICIL
jgi:dephospho-CoA kinase